MRYVRREEFAGAVAHVWARGNNKRPVFEDDEDRRRYLLMLAVTASDLGWRVLAYCLMGNHVHLVVQTPEPNLWKGMEWLQGTYATTYNARWGRMNHLWGVPYGKTLIREPEHLWWAAAYVVLNPVRAGLCDAPDLWTWSSYRATVGLEPSPKWLDPARLLAGYEGDEAAFAAFVDALALGQPVSSSAGVRVA